MIAAVALAAVLAASSPVPSSAQSCCIKPDNGSGTADVPPLQCQYLGRMTIVDGLAPGTTVLIDTELIPLSLVSVNPGGSLGGTQQQWNGDLVMHMTGTGSLSGYNRTVVIAVSCETHSAPRTPFTSPQSFAEDLFGTQGQLPPGDPDFDLLRVTAGTGFGMPSPGHTTLTASPGNNWAVDSFFDITYRIDFVGAPGGPFGGRSGSTTGQERHEICPGPVPTLPVTLGRVKAIYR
jgi:hypothetical protein